MGNIAPSYWGPIPPSPTSRDQDRALSISEDPRSPSKEIPRTPLQVENVSATGVERRKELLMCDPRSPSGYFSRTPLTVQQRQTPAATSTNNGGGSFASDGPLQHFKTTETPLEVENIPAPKVGRQKALMCDPRSPSDNFRRTPLAMHQQTPAANSTPNAGASSAPVRQLLLFQTDKTQNN